MFGTSCDDALIALNYMPLDYVIYCLDTETYLHLRYILHIRDTKFLNFIDLVNLEVRKGPLSMYVPK